MDALAHRTPLAVPDPALVQGDLTLRLPTAEDVAAITAACQDPAIVAFTTVPSPYERTDAEWFVDHVRSGWADGSAASFALSDTDSGAWLGSIGLRLGEDPPSIGYLVAAPHRGRGLAARALGLVTVWASEHLGLTEVVADIFPDNGASRQAARTAGFVADGPATCEQRGRLVPAIRHRWTAT